MSDIEAAAKRLVNFGGDAWLPEEYLESQQMHADMKLAGDYILARLLSDRAEAAERAKPIDAEWLSTCKPDLMFWQKTSEFTEYEFRHQPQPGVLKVVVNAKGHVGFFVANTLAMPITTRGQLLDLMRALKGGAT